MILADVYCGYLSKPRPVLAHEHGESAERKWHVLDLYACPLYGVAAGFVLHSGPVGKSSRFRCPRVLDGLLCFDVAMFRSQACHWLEETSRESLKGARGDCMPAPGGGPARQVTGGGDQPGLLEQAGPTQAVAVELGRIRHELGCGAWETCGPDGGCGGGRVRRCHGATSRRAGAHRVGSTAFLRSRGQPRPRLPDSSLPEAPIPRGGPGT